MKQPVLRTERLTLRSFQPADANTVQTLAGNYQVAKSTLNIPHPYEDGMAGAWIDGHRQGWDSKTACVYAITVSRTAELIGAISLHHIDTVSGELGYWIGEPYWGQGYCTEAARALTRFAFRELGLSTVCAEHLTSNPASGKVMEKIGMYHLGQALREDRHGVDARVERYEIRKS